jgi:hypothetical protein
MEHSFNLVRGKFTAQRGQRYAVDTSSAPISVDLPTTTSLIPGEALFFMDLGGNFSKNPLTIIASDTNINGTATTLVLDTSGDSIGLLWTGTTWRTYE